MHMCITLLDHGEIKEKRSAFSHTHIHTHVASHLCTANDYNEAIKHRNSLVVDYGIFDNFEYQ